MGRYEYITVDVFTDRAFSGNPVAVMIDARGLSTEQMHGIAAEFNALLASLAPDRDAVVTLDIRQGAEMGRPSLLTATAEKQGGSVTRVRVGGRCVAMMEGTFTV